MAGRRLLGNALRSTLTRAPTPARMLAPTPARMLAPTHMLALTRASRPALLLLVCLLVCLLACLIASTEVHAFSALVNTTDARLRAMGGAGVTTATGVTATYSNPALLALLDDYEVLVTFPVILPQVVNTVTLREFGAAAPIFTAPHPHVAAAVNYQRYHYTEDSESTALSFSAGMRLRPWLTAGLAARRIGQSVNPEVLGTDGDATLGWDFGLLAHRRLAERAERFIEGRIGFAYRNWGPDLRLGEIRNHRFTVPLPEEYALGLGVVMGDANTRFTLSYEFSEFVGVDGNAPATQKYGVELELYELLALRAGHTDIAPTADNTQGVGMTVPLPRFVSGRFDYTRLPGGKDLYATSFSLQRAPRPPARFHGRPIQPFVALSVAAAANRPYDGMLNPGPGIRVGALVPLTDDLELENQFGWTWLPFTTDTPSNDKKVTALDFGTGLRHRIDFGKLSPFVTGGVRGYRVGASWTQTSSGGEVTARSQGIAAGYFLGLGISHRPAAPGKPGSDLGVRVHFFRPAGMVTPVTAVELTYAVVFR